MSPPEIARQLAQRLSLISDLLLRVHETDENWSKLMVQVDDCLSLPSKKAIDILQSTVMPPTFNPSHADFPTCWTTTGRVDKLKEEFLTACSVRATPPPQKFREFAAGDHHVSLHDSPALRPIQTRFDAPSAQPHTSTPACTTPPPISSPMVAPEMSSLPPPRSVRSHPAYSTITSNAAPNVPISIPIKHPSSQPLTNGVSPQPLRKQERALPTVSGRTERETVVAALLAGSLDSPNPNHFSSTIPVRASHSPSAATIIHNDRCAESSHTAANSVHRSLRMPSRMQDMMSPNLAPADTAVPAEIPAPFSTPSAAPPATARPFESKVPKPRWPHGPDSPSILTERRPPDTPLSNWRHPTPSVSHWSAKDGLSAPRAAKDYSPMVIDRRSGSLSTPEPTRSNTPGVQDILQRAGLGEFTPVFTSNNVFSSQQFYKLTGRDMQSLSLPAEAQTSVLTLIRDYWIQLAATHKMTS
ncbi:hypothetical protein DIPPA_19529 [Diplonema papillatum]|nr:hypothetical protein DIPPA_19529 [Diplonema papillatum]